MFSNWIAVRLKICNQLESKNVRLISMSWKTSWRGAAVAHQAHNLKIAGSNPAAATRKQTVNSLKRH